MNRLSNRPYSLSEILNAICRGDIAGLKMHFCDSPVIARDKTKKDLGQKAPLLGAQSTHDAEINWCKAALMINEKVALMHVGVKKAIPHRMP